MRCILIDPFARDITELSLPMSGDFMRYVAEIVGANTLALDSVPGETAMFIDAIGYMRAPEALAFWRPIAARDDVNTSGNIAGRGLMFGLGPDGKLVDLPAGITIDKLSERVFWTTDTIADRIERMQIVATPGGPVPIIHRKVVWTDGEAIPAKSPSVHAVPAGGAQGAGDAYAVPEQGGTLPTPPAAAPARPAALSSLWAIRETADNRYQALEYEVREDGLGPVMSMRTVANLDDARALVPPGLAMRPADDDTADDSLVETWS